MGHYSREILPIREGVVLAPLPLVPLGPDVVFSFERILVVCLACQYGLYRNLKYEVTCLEQLWTSISELLCKIWLRYNRERAFQNVEETWKNGWNLEIKTGKKYLFKFLEK